MKEHFPIFEKYPDLVFLDNANSTQKPLPVIQTSDNFFRYQYANIQRGLYDLSESAENLYIGAKKKVAHWIGASSTSEVVTTYSSTYAANLIAQTFAYNGVLKAGDTVVLSLSEHHANIVPWLMLKEKLGIRIVYVQLDEEFRHDLDHLKTLLDDSVKVVSLQHVSNVTGAIHPIEKVRSIIGPDRYFVVDMAQSVPHMTVDMSQIDCDFAFFSGHKMMATTGIGILYGKKHLLKDFQSPFSGGGAINFVQEQSFEEAGLPYKWEPGTQNVGGMIGLGAAIDFLSEHRSSIESKENENIIYALDRFAELAHRGVRLYGSSHTRDRYGVFSCTVDGAHPSDIVEAMAQEGICVRAGHHCCEPLHAHWGASSTVRMSLFLYNDTHDIDRFFTVLERYLHG